MANNGGDPIDPRASVAKHALWGGYEIRKQTEYIITERLKPALEASGASLETAVKAQAYLQNVDDFPHFMDVWSAHFGQAPCALSVIPTAGFGVVDGIIEINMLAVTSEAAARKRVVQADVPSTMSYGPAVRAGDLLCIPTLMAVNEDGSIPEVDDAGALRYFGASAQAQMRYILRQADKICRAAGTSLDNLVRVHQFHTDLSEFYPMFRVWEEVLPDTPIPFTAVRVPGPMPAPGCTVMVDLWVYAPEGA
jgi:enamine deaminase RidA (YjgF/YER057c/UK114 family)